MTKIAFLTPLKDKVNDVVAELRPDWADLHFAASLSPGDQLACARDASYFAVVGSHVTAALIAAAPGLKLIQKWGVGVDKIDLDAARDRGVSVAITAGANANPVAEQAIALMFAVARRIPRADADVRAGRWTPAELRESSFQLRGKRLGLVGYGNIGRRVGQIATGIGMEVVWFDPGVPADIHEGRHDSLDAMLPGCDIVSMHLPFTPQTHRLLSRERIALMKPGAVVINTARGETIDEPALIEALQAGRLAGAGLDAFDGEPLKKDSPLVKLPNVVLTPHAGGGVFDNVPNMARHVFANIDAVHRGESLRPADRIL